MKRPRSFIALVVLATGFLLALSSVPPTVPIAGAETLPVLRVDPRMGDPEDPGFSKELPFDELSSGLRSGGSYLDLHSSTPTIATVRTERGQLRAALRFWLSTYVIRRWR